VLSLSDWWLRPARHDEGLVRTVVWSAGWAYHWQHDPEGSLLAARPCQCSFPWGHRTNQLDRWGYRKELEHLWRYGVLGYCGVDPIRIELLTDCAFESAFVHGILRSPT